MGRALQTAERGKLQFKSRLSEHLGGGGGGCHLDAAYSENAENSKCSIYKTKDAIELTQLRYILGKLTPDG